MSIQQNDVYFGKKFINSNIKWIYIVLNDQSLHTTITILK